MRKKIGQSHIVTQAVAARETGLNRAQIRKAADAGLIKMQDGCMTVMDFVALKRCANHVKTL